jgi:hypothetical protein
MFPALFFAPPPPHPVPWTRSNTLALALAACSRCEGAGCYEVTTSSALRQHLYKLQHQAKPKGITPRAWLAPPVEERLCPCVFRAIFRECLERFAECQVLSEQGDLSAVEFSADFLRVAQQRLTADEHQIFRCYFLLGAEAKLCSSKLERPTSQIYKTAYQIEAKLGRLFGELKPHGLYPVSQYFSLPKAA